MKKLVFFFLLISKSALLGQTVLNSYPLNLDTSYDRNPFKFVQAVNIEDEKTHDLYVFASDNKNLSILKYNKAVFLKSQYQDSIKVAYNRALIGQSISDDGHPILYWSSATMRNLKIIKYFMDNKVSKTLNFDFPSYHDYIITYYQKNNIFYILAKEKNEPHLILYELNNGKCTIRMFDFSSFLFQNEKKQNFSFSTVIDYFPIQKMEYNDFNPLDKTTNKTKMYVHDDHITLSFDYNLKQTQVFNLNFETQEVTEKNYPQPVGKKASGNSNSLYYDNKLFQIKTNSEEMLLDIKDFESAKTIKSIAIAKNDTIRFKSSPLFLQLNDQKPQELKTTGRFLKNLLNVNPGISIFKNHENNAVTLGGFLEYEISEFGSNNYDQNDYFNGFDDANRNSIYSQRKMVFFDTMLNSNLEFTNTRQQEPLAMDNLFYYLSTNKNVSLQSILKIQDYYLLSYYDTASKQYVIRKFTDGFMQEDYGNPIINKSQFSKPSSFGKIKVR